MFLLFLLPLGLYFWFGLQHLTQFETADEHFWISEGWPNGNHDIVPARIPTYWQAFEEKRWQDTLINDKPGIAVAIVSGLGQYLYHGWPDRVVEQNDYSQVFDPERSERVNFAFRLPLLILNGVLGVFILVTFWRLTRRPWTALIGATLIVVSPILIGITQIVNPDALLWSFVTLSLLSFLLFVQKRRWHDAVLTSLFLGFALLSKYTAVILFPFFFVVILLFLFLNATTLIAEGRLRRTALILGLSYPFVIALAVLVFSLGLPAVYVNPELLWVGVSRVGHFFGMMEILLYADGFLLADAIIFRSRIIGFIFSRTQIIGQLVSRTIYATLFLLVVVTVVNWMADNTLSVPSIAYDEDDASVMFAGVDIFRRILLESYPLVFSLTPLALLGLLLSWGAAIFRKNGQEFALLSLTGFLVAFFAGVLSQSLLVNVRYGLVAYPVALLIAAYGLSLPFDRSGRWRFVRLPLFLLIVAGSVASLWSIRPFYFNYANDLLPKQYIVSGAWGLGAYEAAQFINARAEDPSQLTVWTDYEGFCPFFGGRCIKGTQLYWNKRSVKRNVDYYVTSRRGAMRMSERTEADMDRYRDDEPLWEMHIDGRPGNFIRVYGNRAKELGVCSL